MSAAAAAALLAALGDVLMLLVAHGHAASPGSHLPDVLLWLGGGLGTLVIPIYHLGYRSALRLFEPAPAWARVILVGGALVGLFGAATHGLTAIDIHAAIAAGHGVRPPAEAFSDWTSPLAVCAMVAAAGAVAAAIALVVAGRNARGRLKIASLLNPVSWTIALSVIATASEVSAAYLGPSAPNLAHFVFFLMLARMRRDRGA